MEFNCPRSQPIIYSRDCGCRRLPSKHYPRFLPVRVHNNGTREPFRGDPPPSPARQIINDALAARNFSFQFTKLLLACRADPLDSVSISCHDNGGSVESGKRVVLRKPYNVGFTRRCTKSNASVDCRRGIEVKSKIRDHR